MKIIIIGGVAGGASCAARLRRRDETCKVIIFEKGPYISFANCGLPYHLSNVISKRDRLLLHTPQSFTSRFNVDVRVNTEVTVINRDEKKVTAFCNETGQTYEETYDKLVLAPGARPRLIDIPGLESSRLKTLRTMDDMDSIIAYLKHNSVKNIAVIGGGFIGLEAAENLRHRGYTVDLVEAAPQVMTSFDTEMAAFLHSHLVENGIRLHLETTVTNTVIKDSRPRLQLTSGDEISADLVVMCIGVVPDTRLAEKAGLDIGKTGGIKVNDTLQTSEPDIYAAGDAIEIRNYLSNHACLVPLAGPANKQARIIADNLTGGTATYTGSIATAIVKLFNLTAASTGLNCRYCRLNNIVHESVIIHSASHAGYYPGAGSFAFKLVFNPESGKILGSQVIGTDGVDKRIDVIAAYIMKHGTVNDLTEFDHAYAPPYSSAKDPVSMIGFAAENVMNGLIKKIECAELNEWLKKDVVIIDVRTSGEYTRGHIDTTIHIPLNQLRENLEIIPREKPVILVCATGLRSYIAGRILIQKGFSEVYNLAGGMQTYTVYREDLFRRSGNVT